jgi:hypothetical protein
LSKKAPNRYLILSYFIIKFITFTMIQKFSFKPFAMAIATLIITIGSNSNVKAAVAITSNAATINGTVYNANTNLGAVPQNSLALQGSIATSTQNSGDDVCTVFADYAVSGGGPSGTLTLGFVSQSGSAPNWTKEWSITGQSINIANLPNGAYTLTISYRIFGRFGNVTCFASTNGFTTGSLATRTINFTVNSALPVTLTHFNAKNNNATNLLTWTTANEVNNKGFEVERSADGRTFEAVGFVEGRGNSREAYEYTYTDRVPMSGDNYYRLRQIDVDGRATYSQVVRVNTRGLRSVSVTPNPILSEVIHLSLQGFDNEQVTLELFRTDGTLIRSAIMESDNQLTWSVPELTAGVYLLRVNGVATRIVKQ